MSDSTVNLDVNGTNTINGNVKLDNTSLTVKGDRADDCMKIVGDATGPNVLSGTGTLTVQNQAKVWVGNKSSTGTGAIASGISVTGTSRSYTDGSVHITEVTAVSTQPQAATVVQPPTSELLTIESGGQDGGTNKEGTKTEPQSPGFYLSKPSIPWDTISAGKDGVISLLASAGLNGEQVNDTTRYPETFLPQFCRYDSSGKIYIDMDDPLYYGHETLEEVFYFEVSKPTMLYSVFTGEAIGYVYSGTYRLLETNTPGIYLIKDEKIGCGVYVKLEECNTNGIVTKETIDAISVPKNNAANPSPQTTGATTASAPIINGFTFSNMSGLTSTIIPASTTTGGYESSQFSYAP